MSCVRWKIYQMKNSTFSLFYLENIETTTITTGDRGNKSRFYERQMFAFILQKPNTYEHCMYKIYCENKTKIAIGVTPIILSHSYPSKPERLYDISIDKDTAHR